MSKNRTTEGYTDEKITMKICAKFFLENFCYHFENVCQLELLILHLKQKYTAAKSSFIPYLSLTKLCICSLAGGTTVG